MKLGFYLFAEYINMFISGAVMATLFFGGYDYPGYAFVAGQFGTTVAAFVGMGALIGKALLFVFVFMWVRWTLPRFRYDQLIRLGWKVFLPFTISWSCLTSGILLSFNWLL